MVVKFKILHCLAILLICGTFVLAQDIKPEFTLVTDTPCGNPMAQSDGYHSYKEDENVLVIKVIDGNTILVKLSDKTQKHFDLGGLDAPDIETENGKRSQSYLEKLLLNKRVTLLRHHGAEESETIGGRVSLKTPPIIDVTEKMLESGMAYLKESDFLTSFDSCMYEKTAEKATSEGKGLWKNNR